MGRVATSRRATRYVGLAVAIALLTVAAAALASTGALTGEGCTADPTNNPDACTQTAKGLDGVISPAASPDGKSVYAAGITDSAIVRFKRDPATGVLTAKGCIGEAGSNLDQCGQTAKGLARVGAVAVSRDGKSVYAVGESSNALVRFERDTTTGALTPKGCIGDAGSNLENCGKTAKGLSEPDAIVVSPDGKSVYVAGYDDFALVIFSRDTTTGALTPKGCIAEVGARSNPAHCGQRSGGLDEPYYGSVAVSPDGRFVYTAGSAGPSIGRFRRNTTTGALSPNGCIADNANNPEGCTQTTSLLSNPYVVVVSNDRKSLYATDNHNNAVVLFQRDLTSGKLTPKSCVADQVNNAAGCSQTAPGLLGIEWTAVSADGRSVYAASPSTNAIVRLDRNTRTGALIPKGCVADPENNPAACALTAPGLDGIQTLTLGNDGKSLYAAGSQDNAIARFNRAP